MFPDALFGITFSLAVFAATTTNGRLTHHQQQIASGKLRNACAERYIPPQPPNRVNTTARLLALRNLMSQSTTFNNDEPLQAYLITSDDEHQTEFVANYDKRREYISGFSGSHGDAIVTLTDAALWVDGRYHLQANDQLDCNWLLMRDGLTIVPGKAEWLSEKFPNGARIGADPKLLSAGAWHALEYDLQELNADLKLVKTDENLVDKIWVNHSLTEQEKHAFSLDSHNYTGIKWTRKVEEVLDELKKLNAQAMVVTALDEIAWLLNVRGRDIPYTRYLKSYVLLSQDEIFLYVDQHKTNVSVVHALNKIWNEQTIGDVRKALNADTPGVENSAKVRTVQIRDYSSIFIDLETKCQTWRSVLVPSFCVYSLGASKAIYDLVPQHIRISLPSPIIYLKAQKNVVERAGMRAAHIRDGAAMCIFLEYLESKFKVLDWNEMKVATVLDEIRMEQDLATNISFPTIAAFGEHGAQPHYEPSISTSWQIFDNSTLVVDSGGQYKDGTTDVTRTIHLGTPTDEERDAYTRVLIGSIQLARLIFPDMVDTSTVDILARSPLWEIGYDYAHGTGHGIGAFLGVHESPIYIHYNSKTSPELFKPGYFFSNEPGIYLEGKFGVRLENILEVVEKTSLKQPHGHSYLGFNDVTLVPYSYKLIDFGLLSFHQRRWLNEYNARIRDAVGTALKSKNKTAAFFWMMENTKYIPEHGHGCILYITPLPLLLFYVFTIHRISVLVTIM